jgi:hypothetical protein
VSVSSAAGTAGSSSCPSSSTAMASIREQIEDVVQHFGQQPYLDVDACERVRVRHHVDSRCFDSGPSPMAHQVNARRRQICWSRQTNPDDHWWSCVDRQACAIPRPDTQELETFCMGRMGHTYQCRCPHFFAVSACWGCLWGRRQRGTCSPPF